MTVAELMQAAVAQSDNTASDVILRLAGGPEAVTAYVRSLGIDGLRVDRPEVQMAADLKGVSLPDASTWTVARLSALFQAPAEQRKTADRRYLHADPRDTATPEAALALLGPRARSATRCGRRRPRIAVRSDEEDHDGRPAHPRRCSRRGRRWRTRPAAGAALGYTAATNDIGIVTLPTGRQIAIAVFVSATRRGRRRARQGDRRGRARGVRSLVALARFERWVRLCRAFSG